MVALTDVLAQVGGVHAPRASWAQLRSLVAGELRRGSLELSRQRTGYRQPVVVAFAAKGAKLLAVCPVDARVRIDAERLSDRQCLLVASVAGALVGATGAETPGDWEALAIEAGASGEYLTLAMPSGLVDAELGALALEDQIRPVARLRAIGVALPDHVLDNVKDLRRPAGHSHPLLVAEAVARLGGRPADPDSMDNLEEAILALFVRPALIDAPHHDSDPARRAARRILQRLDGMGKWGGFHTERRYLARGFPPDQIALAIQVGERLVTSGLLVEKTSVGQRHVFLNPRRAKDIHRLIKNGIVPPDVDLAPPGRR